MKEEVKRIEFPVFNFNVYVVLTDNISASREKRNAGLGAMKHDLNKFVDGLNSYHPREPDTFIFITDKSTIGVVCHECYHAIHRMMKWIGAKHENEVIAYHLSYLVDEVDAFIKSKPLKKQKVCQTPVDISSSPSQVDDSALSLSVDTVKVSGT